MRRYRFLTALALILLPPLARGLWFYRGLYRPPEPIEIPSFQEIRVATPPIQAPAARDIELSDAPAKTVLIDLDHGNQLELPDLDALTSRLNESGAEIEYLGSSFEFDSLGLSERLQYASAYVVIAPLTAFSDSEIRNVARFVERGGRLLVIADPTRSGGGVDPFGFVNFSIQDIAAVNPLLEPHDLSFTNDYLYNVLENEGNFRNVFMETFADHPVCDGLDQVVLYTTRSVTSREGTPLIMTGADVLSSRTDRGGDHAAAALSPDGGVIALGDLTFMTPPYDSVADNARLMDNLADFLLTGVRQRDLTDLPFVFERKVEVLTSPAFAIQSETLSTLRSLSDALENAGFSMHVTQEPSEGSDLIVLALFEPEEETDPYVDLLELTLPIDHADGLLEVPGFGELDPAGIGVIGLVREIDRTTLIVLAEDREKLSELADSVGSGSLSACVIQETLAVCRTGAGSGFESEFEEDEFFDFDLDFEESLPEPTPAGP